ncbi:coiled-coil domain-containing protein 13 [Clonorchis sinensis]|uniref:Coiled-coil domain-containing protein 13 n=1 Tax=Clonorchis sinensis TaxID=79923 RepID=H2KUC9_CLOSI|nr:coiled-coil domain-containing protein 13 [Clonorchis sinensis]
MNCIPNEKDSGDQPFGLPQRLFCSSPRFKETDVESLKPIKEVANLDTKKVNLKTIQLKPCLVTSNGTKPPSELLKHPENQRYGDVAAVKVIELSKKVRELSSSLAHEQNKSRRFGERIRALEFQLREQSKQTDASTGGQNNTVKHSEVECEACKTMKSLQEKLNKTEQCINELKDQNHILDGDLKLARKVLELETGENITNLSNWLRGLQLSCGDTTKGNSGGWRGRQQQIVLLRSKIKNLEIQMGKMTAISKSKVEFAVGEENAESSGATSFGASELDFLDDNRLPGHGSPLSRSRNTIADSNIEKENESLRSELSILRTRLRNSKNREKTATSEFTELKKQLQWVLEKGKHDDELIQSLLDSKTKLQTALEQEVKKHMDLDEKLKVLADESSSLRIQRDTLQTQYQEILDQKNEKIAELERMQKEWVTNTMPTVPDKSQCSSDQTTVQTSDDDNLGKQVEFLTIERDGLRQLVETLNSQLDRQIQEIMELEKKIAETDRCTTASTLGSRIPRFGSNKNASEKSSPTKPDNALDRLCSRDYRQKVINDAGLSVAAATLVGKRIDELQSALGAARDEIKALKSMVKRLKNVRQEDFTILTQIVTQLRSSCSEE